VSASSTTSAQVLSKTAWQASIIAKWPTAERPYQASAPFEQRSIRLLGAGSAVTWKRALQRRVKRPDQCGPSAPQARRANATNLPGMVGTFSRRHLNTSQSRQTISRPATPRPPKLHQSLPAPSVSERFPASPIPHKGSATCRRTLRQKSP
jgi:hypothetical protein